MKYTSLFILDSERYLSIDNVQLLFEILIWFLQTWHNIAYLEIKVKSLPFKSSSLQGGDVVIWGFCYEERQQQVFLTHYPRI